MAFAIIVSRQPLVQIANDLICNSGADERTHGAQDLAILRPNVVEWCQRS